MKKVLLIILLMITSLFLTSCFSYVEFEKNETKIIKFENYLFDFTPRNVDTTATYIVTLLEHNKNEIKLHFRSLYKDKVGIFAIDGKEIYIDDVRLETFYHDRVWFHGFAPFSFSLPKDDFILRYKKDFTSSNFRIKVEPKLAYVYDKNMKKIPEIVLKKFLYLDFY